MFKAMATLASYIAALTCSASQHSNKAFGEETNDIGFLSKFTRRKWIPHYSGTLFCPVNSINLTSVQQYCSDKRLYSNLEPDEKQLIIKLLGNNCMI